MEYGLETRTGIVFAEPEPDLDNAVRMVKAGWYERVLVRENPEDDWAVYYPDEDTDYSDIQPIFDALDALESALNLWVPDGDRVEQYVVKDLVVGQLDVIRATFQEWQDED